MIENASPNRLRCFVRLGPDGEIIELVQTQTGRSGAEWLEIKKQADRDAIMSQPSRYLWFGEEIGFARKPRIRLRVNSPAIFADGRDVGVFCITALELTRDEAARFRVAVAVNGQPQEWEFGRPYEVVTETPGTWIVSIIDRRYYAENTSAVLTAITPAPKAAENA